MCHCYRCCCSCCCCWWWFLVFVVTVDFVGVVCAIAAAVLVIADVASFAVVVFVAVAIIFSAVAAVATSTFHGFLLLALLLFPLATASISKLLFPHKTAFQHTLNSVRSFLPKTKNFSKLKTNEKRLYLCFSTSHMRVRSVEYPCLRSPCPPWPCHYCTLGHH